jgi:hypothetical protein
MQKLITLILLTPLAFAAEEVELWSCQGTAAGGLFWAENRWKPKEFGTRIYRIELRNLTAVISENNDPALMLMDCQSKSWSWSCSNDAASLELNKDLSTAVLMRFFGGIYQDSTSSQKDSIYLEALQCEKI